VSSFSIFPGPPTCPGEGGGTIGGRIYFFRKTMERKNITPCPAGLFRGAEGAAVVSRCPAGWWPSGRRRCAASGQPSAVPCGPPRRPSALIQQGMEGGVGALALHPPPPSLSVGRATSPPPRFSVERPGNGHPTRLLLLLFYGDV